MEETENNSIQNYRKTDINCQEAWGPFPLELYKGLMLSHRGGGQSAIERDLHAESQYDKVDPIQNKNMFDLCSLQNIF